MTAADLVAGARALIKPLTGHTPGEWEMSVTHPTNACANVWCGYTDVATLYSGEGDVPQPADDEPWGPQPIRDANARLTAAAPALRDTVAALADLADALTQRIEVLEAALAACADDFEDWIHRRGGAMRGAYETPSQPCPYCGAECEADWCDVGVGMVQVGPYVCMDCMASEASAYGDHGSRSDFDPSTGWYRPGSPLDDLANQDEDGKPISWQEADTRYRAEHGVPARYRPGFGYGPKGHVK